MADVIVVGAGVAGAAAARALAATRDVTVLDREGVAAGATGLSAGLVAPTLFYGDRPDVARHATAFFESFDGTHDFSFTRRDRLDFVTPDEEREARATADRLAGEGFPVEYLEADEVVAGYPWFAVDEFAGAVEYRDTGWVDPYSYASALLHDAEDRGARVETGVSVDGVVVEGGGGDGGDAGGDRDGRVVGVETDDGRRDADAVVVAAGWRSREVVPEGIRLPIRPYRTQVVVLEPEKPLPDEFPLGRVGSRHLYFRPEHNGDLLVGGAHHLIDDPTAASGDADEAFRQQVADYVPDLIERFDRAGFVNGWAGIDAATPDTRPIVDAVGPDGLVVATGFNGLGVMVSPIVGQAVRALLDGEPAPFETGAFRLDRFDSVEPDFEYVSTSDL